MCAADAAKNIQEALERTERAQMKLTKVEERLKSAQNEGEKETAEKMKSDCLREVEAERAVVFHLQLQNAVQSQKLADVEFALENLIKEHVSGREKLVAEVSRPNNYVS